MSEGQKWAGGQELGERKTFWMIVALFVAELSSPFPAVIMLAAFPAAIRQFGNPAMVSSLITVFLLVSVVAVAIVGRLGDLIGRRQVLIWVLIISTIGSVISLIGTTFEVILAGRALQGVSGAILPLAIGILRERSVPKRLPVRIGYLTMSAAIATGAALLVGGIIVDNFHWTAIFVVTAGLSVLGLILVLTLVPTVEMKKERPPFDWIGLALFAPAIAALMLGVNTLSDADKVIQTVSYLAGSVVLLAIFDRHERNTEHPLINVQLLRKRQIVIANLCLGIGAMAAYVAALVMSLQMQQPEWTGVGLGLSAAVVGLWKLPSNLLGSFGSITSGHMVVKQGARQALLVGGIVVTTGWLAMTFFHATIWQVAFFNILIAFGFQMIYPAANAAIVEICEPRATSEALAVTQISRGFFMALGAQLVTMLLAVHTVAPPEGQTGTFPSGFAYYLAMGVVTGIVALTIVMAIALPKRSADARQKQWG